MISEKALSVLAACAVTLSALTIAAPGIAKERRPVVVTAPDQDVAVRHVSYRDLNLATTLGEKKLYHRVGYAVSGVCAESVGRGALLYVGMACRKDAWGGARPQIERAVRRARDIAQFGTSTIPAVAISISFAPR